MPTVPTTLYRPAFQLLEQLVEQLNRRFPSLLEFLHYDFAGLRARYGTTVATTFRSFPSYPRRYRESVEGLPLPTELERARVEKVIDAVPATVFASDDLQMREFTGTGARMVAAFAVPAVAA